jgi:CDP-diacylglycerol---glycerol-3-phosphate 3-phosphatidyltransferase
VFDGRWRTTVEQGVKPVGSAIRRTGITADHLTATGLVMAGATAVAIGSGRLFLGLVLLGLAAIPDLLDGAVAKASGTASTRGAFFDSVADRVTDSLVLGGIAWHFAVTDGGLAPMLPFAVLGSSTLISYERAKAESLGFNAKGGLMERAERIIVLAIGLAFPVLLVPVLWLMLATTLLTAGQRFVKVWKQASVELPTRPTRATRPTTERWRAWREERTAGTTRSVIDWRGSGARRGSRDTRRRTPEWRRRVGGRRP